VSSLNAPMPSGASATLSRRERVRAATLDEIMRTARRLLVDEGVAGISLRAIGREMGMTAAALYRYYPSHEGLMNALCADLFTECRHCLEAARDDMPADDLGAQMFAMCRAFRRWSIAHPAEFGLMFGSPVPGPTSTPDSNDCGKHEAGTRFAATFAGLFTAIWLQAPFPVPADDEIAPALAEQLRAYVAELGAPLPLGAVQLFLSCWIRLYGMVAMEVFGHIHFAFSDVEPMFEAELQQAAAQLGLTRRY
jgi:AcrR family transcriptional regulator